MTLQGVINKTGILLLLCLGAAAFGWTQTALRGPLIVIGLIGGFIVCMVGIFKPTTTPVTAPLYAVLEGLLLGCISQVMELRFPGIAVNAMLLTFGVLGLMLMLYTTRTIRVTSGLVKGITAATMAVFLVYLVDIVLNMFGARVPLLHETGLIGIGISLVIVGIAAFNLLIDFAVIEDGVSRGSPKYMEWYLWDGAVGDPGVALSGAAPLAGQAAGPRLNRVVGISRAGVRGGKLGAARPPCN